MNSLPARRIGQTELEVSVLGLGGAPLGDLYERIPEERALATLETAYRRGIRFFDTAPLYGHGLSEHRLGHVLRSKPRANLVVSTKVGRWLRPERGERVDRGQFVGDSISKPSTTTVTMEPCARSSRATNASAWIE